MHTEKQAQRLDQLNHLALLLSQAPDSKAAFQAVARHLADIVGCDRSSLVLLNEKRTACQVFALDGEIGNVPTGIDIPLVGTMVGRAIESKTLIKANDRQRQPYINSQRMAQMGILSTMCAPLRVENQIIGTLNVGLKQLRSEG